MNHYELLYIVSGAYAEDELTPIKEKVKQTIRQNGGEVSIEDSLGKRKLAFPIKKARHGYYIIFEFDLEPEALKKLDSDLSLTTEVLRHLVVKKPIKAPSLSLKKQKTTTLKSDIGQSSADRESTTEKSATGDKEKISLEDLDKKLDEILEGDII